MDQISQSQATDHARRQSEDDIRNRLKAMAKGFSYSFRAPLLKTPADYGLDFEDVTFASQDGVPLEAWFIPCPGSTKLIIANHPRWFNRYGCPAHIEPWRFLGI